MASNTSGRRTIQQNRPRPLECFQCGQQGHFVCDCPQKRDTPPHTDSVNTLTQLLQSASITRQPNLLYVDILNYCEVFFNRKSIWDMKKSLRKIEKFVNSARRSGYSLKIFIESNIMSNEAINKWRTRRAREIRLGYKNVPHGLSTLLGDMFRRCNVPVVYSKEADNDDTIAFHAHADGAAILSGDGDFFRYKDASYMVWADFDRTLIHQGRLVLLPHSNENKRKNTSVRELGPPPAVNFKDDFSYLKVYSVYRRGAASPLVRLMGFNPHAVVNFIFYLQII